jgi:UDP-3-O-[3-hydroxymyristoyl] glucosamine N-acyltransferase
MTHRTLSELAQICGATLQGDPARIVTGCAALREAQPDQVSFFAHPRYRRDLEATRAGAVLVQKGSEIPRQDLALLWCDDPSRAFSDVIRTFAPERPRPEPGVHPSAVVHPSAHLGLGISVGALCTVGPRARLAAGVVLHEHVVVGADASVGEASELFPMVVLYPQVAVGARCLVHSGAVLGSDGYGFDPGPKGWSKIPQCGTVVVEDEVEIGANCTIDRGRFGATRIGRGAKLDNLVHVAHNVVVGEHALLIAQVGIAGSARIGKRAILAGQVGVNGHVEIGDGARVAGQSGVTSDVEPGLEVLGNPARPRLEALRSMANAGRVGELLERVKELEKRVQELTSPKVPR